MNWSSYDLPGLRRMYEQEAEILQKALLNGTAWEEMRDQRKKVTDLAIALHKKRFAGPTPADGPSRNERSFR